MNGARSAIIVLAALLATAAEACPCGCGNVATATLEPGQRAKAAVAASSEDHVDAVDPTGARQDGYLYERSRKEGATLTYALDARTAVSMAAGVYRNEKGGERSDALPQDPSVTLGRTLARQDFTRPWLPRVDAFVSYKHPAARSFREAEADASDESFLAVGGNGLREVALALQAQVGEVWRAGGTGRVTVFPEVLRGEQPGPDGGGAMSLQLSHVWTGRGSATLESGIEWLRDGVDEEGARVAGTSRRVDHMRLGVFYVLTPLHGIGLSGTERGALGATRNSVASRSVELSYQAIFL